MVTINSGHNTVTLTNDEIRQVLASDSHDVVSLLLFAAQVGCKLLDDYRVPVNMVEHSRLLGMIHDCWVDGFTTTDCAFRIVNGWQEHRD